MQTQQRSGPGSSSAWSRPSPSAASIASARSRTRTRWKGPAGIPYLFSDQYDLSMESVGVVAPGDRLVVRGDLAAREFVALWLADDDRVVAALTANVHGLTKPLERLIRSRAVVDPSALADASTDLDALPVAA